MIPEGWNSLLKVFDLTANKFVITKLRSFVMYQLHIWAQANKPVFSLQKQFYNKE